MHFSALGWICEIENRIQGLFRILYIHSKLFHAANERHLRVVSNVPLALGGA
jgi:hypothetical protein